MKEAVRPEGPARAEPGRGEARVWTHRLTGLAGRSDALAPIVFVWPALLVLLFLSIFPLIVSLYLSLSRLQFVKGGFEIKFVGLANFRKLLVGSQKTHFLGAFAGPSPFGWVIFGLVVLAVLVLLWRYLRREGISLAGLIGRVAGAALVLAGAWLAVRTLTGGGRPGTLVVTLFYVFAGLTIQYALGLGLAWLAAQRIPGRRFFRIVFLLPMMITPVGVAYTFRMLTDTTQGPFAPIWRALGLAAFSWVNDPWGARAAVLVSDIWQWTPFMFIVLLAALESQSREHVEAAMVDGANGWQVFWHITLPGVLPVSTTLILIRMIEAFKIVDLPNVLTNGGPGTATESLTLHAFTIWRALDVGGSAAVAYLLLLVVTVIAVAYVHFVRQRLSAAFG